MKIITRVPIQGQNFQQPALSVKIPIKTDPTQQFKITTESGYSWIANWSKGLAEARKFFMNGKFDISALGQGAKFESVVSVEPVS